jgi:hypothetical protein
MHAEAIMVMKIRDFALPALDTLDFDHLRGTQVAPGTLILDADISAADVAERIDETKTRLVMLVTAGQIFGVVTPYVVMRALEKFTGKTPASFTDAVKAIEGIGKIPFDFPALAHVLHKCPVGPHYTAEWPCPDHP